MAEIPLVDGPIEPTYVILESTSVRMISVLNFVLRNNNAKLKFQEVILFSPKPCRSRCRFNASTYKSLLTAMRRSQGLRGERDYNDLAKGHGVLLPRPSSATR